MLLSHGRQCVAFQVFTAHSVVWRSSVVGATRIVLGAVGEDSPVSSQAVLNRPVLGAPRMVLGGSQDNPGSSHQDSPGSSQNRPGNSWDRPVARTNPGIFPAHWDMYPSRRAAQTLNPLESLPTTERPAKPCPKRQRGVDTLDNRE